MSWNASLTTSQVQAIFEEEVKSAGGKVTDSFNDDTLLFSRAVLPKNKKVARKDRVDKGRSDKGGLGGYLGPPIRISASVHQRSDSSSGRGDKARNEYGACEPGRDGN